MRLPSTSPFPLLRRQVDSLLSDSLFPPSNVAMQIVSLSTGETLYALNPDLALHPASNQKLFTSACALSELGPAYSFVTRAFVDTSVTPRIFVRGSGDPLLSTIDLDSLSSMISRTVMPGREWVLAGDISLFDDLPRGAGWAWDDEPDPTAMLISPLSLNGNTIRLLIRPGESQGDSVLITVDPPSAYVSVDNNARTSSAAPRSHLTVSRKGGSNTFTVSGELSRDDSLVATSVSIAGPEWYTLTVLREKLESRGVHCAGTVIDTIPPGLAEAGRIEHRLDSVLIYMNQTSDNLSAENLLKTVAAEKTAAPGSAAEGSLIMKAFLSGFGIDTTRVVLADGSGVSRYDLASARAIICLLAGMRTRADLFPLWYRSLPLAGVSGTLATRMRGTPAEGNLRAKTGSLQGVSNLSGYVTTADGEQLAFAIVMQHFPGSGRRYRQVQDQIGAFLAGLRRSAH